MKTFEEDKKLKSLLKSVKPESPSSDFSVKVMNRIFREESTLEKIKRERILGKGFWIIMVLFFILFSAMFIFNAKEGAADAGFYDYMPGLETNTVARDYTNLFERLGSVPISVAGILLASSILVLTERFLSLKKETLKNG